MRKNFVFTMVAVSMAIAMGACAKSAGSNSVISIKDARVVFIPKLSGNMFFESANDGAQALATKVGYNIKYDGNPEASVANQVQIINNAIAQGYNAIVISALSLDGLNRSLENARKEGIKIVTWDSDVKNEFRSLMVSQGTAKQLGQMLIDMAASQLPDPKAPGIKYVWHYSSPTVADQNSWQVEGERYAKEKYPNWVNVAPNNYYSDQDAAKAVEIGQAILEAHPDIKIIICNDSTALPGQAQAVENKRMKDKVIVTGFATPSSMRNFVKNGTVKAFGLWDSGMQGALATYLGAYLASGKILKVGDKVDVPTIGEVEVLPNTVLDENAYTAENSGVVLLPERLIFTKDNIDNYKF